MGTAVFTPVSRACTKADRLEPFCSKQAGPCGLLCIQTQHLYKVMGQVANWVLFPYLSPLPFSSLLIGRKLMNRALSEQMFLVGKKRQNWSFSCFKKILFEHIKKTVACGKSGMERQSQSRSQSTQRSQDAGLCAKRTCVFFCLHLLASLSPAPLTPPPSLRC